MILSIFNYIFSGLVGGVFAAILYPFIVHVGVRRYNKYKVKIYLDEVDTLNCRVLNDSFVTLKNVVAYITINNDKKDLVLDPETQVFCSDKQILDDRLSWSKNIKGENFSELDICQGESQKLNLFRIRSISSNTVIEIASEQGFFSKDLNNRSRAILHSNRNYIFEIKVIGDNLWPIKKTFTYNYLTQQITDI